MGVEHFLDRYKEDGTATLDFTRMVSRGIEEESSRGHFKSTLSFIAEKFIRHGAIEIKGIEMEGGIQFAGTAETEEPNKNFGAVLMGNLIVEIENTLIDIRANKGVYNLYGFMERMKNDLGSLPPLKPDFQMTEKITKRKRKEMYEAAKRDRTLGIFFRKRGLMPRILENFLEDNYFNDIGQYKGFMKALEDYEELCEFYFKTKPLLEVFK